MLDKTWFQLFIITILALGIYLPGLNYDFVLDDKIVFTENAYVKKGFKGIPKILASDSFEGYFGEQKDLLPGARYRPLSLITFAMEYEFSGANKMLSHGLNILLYIACTFLLFFTLRSVFRDSAHKEFGLFALAAVIIFTVHPVHVEAVANIKGRDEILALIFSLLALKCAHQYVNKQKNVNLIFLAIFLFLGFLSKENTLTFLAIIPFSVALFARPSRKNWLFVTGALLLPTVAYFVLRFYAVGYVLGSVPSDNLMNNPFLNMTASQKYATIFHVMLLYFKLLIVPHPLTHDYYPFHIPTMSWSNITPILSVAMYTVLTLAVFLVIKRNKVLSWSIFFFLASISIVCNLFVNVGTFMNERFLFMPSVAYAVLFSFLLMQIYQRNNLFFKFSAFALFAIISAGYTFKSVSRLPDWKNSYSLNSSAVKVSRNSARANLFMGTTYFNQYRESQNIAQKTKLLNAADQYITRSFELFPKYGNANHMMAGVAAEKFRSDGDIKKLLDVFSSVIRQRPDTPFIHTYIEYLNNSSQFQGALMSFYYSMGYRELHKKQNENYWAIKYLLYGLQINENDRSTNLALSEIYRSINRNREANYYQSKALSQSNEQ